jgi:hypothetical protein
MTRQFVPQLLTRPCCSVVREGIGAVARALLPSRTMALQLQQWLLCALYYRYDVSICLTSQGGECEIDAATCRLWAVS